MADSPLSDLSSLSSAESVETDEEILQASAHGGKLDRWIKSSRASTTPPPKRKRPASPPHEYVLADNSDIAFIVMFRARFAAAFPRSVPNFGPQDIERGIVDSLLDDSVEKLLCALIGLVLNRKKDVEKGHYTRALEEAISTNSHQWPREWDGKNPLHGGGNFNNMTPAQRLTLLKSLVLWALNSSDSIQSILKESYKQQRHEDDLNQPLSVQPWGRDGDKRRYWLIEGQDDTHFRLYRESNPALKTNTWWSVADSIESIKTVAQKLEEDGTQPARRLKDRILAAIPRFEAGEDVSIPEVSKNDLLNMEQKRKRRDYRIARKNQFARPEPGFSIYEGRTRGKKVKYTFSDDEGDGSDALSTRRSTRQSGVSTPAEPIGPMFTASGRQVKARVGGTYGEIMHSGQQDAEHEARLANGEVESEMGVEANGGRSTRSGHQTNGHGSSHTRSYNAVDEMDDESDATSSGNEWNGADDDEDDVDDNIADDEGEEDEASDGSPAEDEDDTGHKSLVVSLKVPQDQTVSPNLEIEKSDVVMTNGLDSPADSISLIDAEPQQEHEKIHSNLAAEAEAETGNNQTTIINAVSNSSNTALGKIETDISQDRPMNRTFPDSPEKPAAMIASLPKPVPFHIPES